MRARELFAAFAVVVTSVLAQDHSSEESEAQITDPIAECTTYYYEPVAQSVHTFPPIWQPATLLQDDTEGQALWAKISGSIPNIPPKGQLNGSTIGVMYDSVNDPDCWWSISRCTTPKRTELPVDVSSVPEPRTIGYGFDDGPNCTHNIFYDYLSSQNQKATMFFIGSSVMNWPLEAQRALADGHQICGHSWSHRYMTAFSSEDAFAELWYSIQAIKLVTGVTPTCWRPPYGDVDDRIRAIANAMGLQTILWKYDSNDWRVFPGGNYTVLDVDTSYQLFINNLTAGTFDTAGGIILTHEVNNFTMQEAINWYPKLKAAFSYIVPVGVALNTTNPYVETDYSLPTFEEYTSGQVTASGDGSGSGTSASTSPNSSPSSGSGTSSSSGNAKSSASSITVPRGIWWALLSAAMVLFRLVL